jgi:Fic family protein
MKSQKSAFEPLMLPLSADYIRPELFFDSLIDATAELEVYKEKIKDSKLSQHWFLPTLQQKEALASSMLEGTQATLDGVLINQVVPDDKDTNLVEIINYNAAAIMGYSFLKREKMSKDFILEIHKILMRGKARRQNKEIGVFRTQQNYIGKVGGSHEITYTPPIFEKVPELMDNLINYILEPKDTLRPLVRTAIVHAQFETIHPFLDGNGRVGRILIPLYLYASEQIDMPCFFISEALERDKMKYYTLLNNIREKNQWSEWINFFLQIVTSQCKKYIRIISDINKLYDEHLSKASDLVRSNQMTEIIDLLFRFPIINANTVAKETNIPPATINRYLNALVKAQILYTDNKSRNRTFFYYDLLNIIRD